VDRLIGRSRAVLPSAHCPDDDGEERGLGVVLGDGAVAEFAGGGLDECEESAGRCSKWWSRTLRTSRSRLSGWRISPSWSC